jgi:large subunit ribosomal protein L18e
MVLKGPDNPVTQRTIVALERAARKNKAAIWGKAAKRIKAGRRRYAEANMEKLSQFAGKTLLVPGKVLGMGDLDKAVTVAAISFSASAREKIAKKGGKALTILELVEYNPKGKDVTYLG